MLRSHHESAPAHSLLKRVHDEPNFDLTQHSADQSSLFWPSSDVSPLSATAFRVDSTPKTGSYLALDLLPAHSGADLLQAGLSALDNDHSVASGPPSATTASGADSKSIFFASSTSSGCQSSPAMSASSNYNFETPSLQQVSALAAPFATSSPNVGSVGTADGNSGKTSPSHHESSWFQASSHDRKPFDGPTEASSNSTFPPSYTHKSTSAASAHQSQQPQQAYYNDHDYHAHGTHPGVSQYYQHRASFSGPLMDSASYAERYESAAAAAPAPPRVHGLAAWENASGSARPHTADGLFSQFGAFGAGAASHDASADTSGMSNSTASSSRPYTPGGHTAAIDAYYAQRRMSMPDPSMAAGASKVFSYMAPGEDGAMGSSSGLNAGSQSYGSHYFGGYSGGASKKRPRRRYDEIERLYPCSWPGCTKSYGTLNHLNAHVAMQKHGPKRSPSEFKDMRKAWRKQKKEEEHRRQSRQLSLTDQTLRPSYGGGSNYAAGLPSSEMVGGSSGNASVLPIAPPAALSGFSSGGGGGGSGNSNSNSNSNGSLPGIGQMPGSLAHLSRYSMSSVSTAPNANTAQQSPFYLNSASADAGLHSSTSAHSHVANTSAHPLQYHPTSNESSRLGYAPSSSAAPTSSNNAQYSNLGAYLSAHRNSVQ